MQNLNENNMLLSLPEIPFQQILSYLGLKSWSQFSLTCRLANEKAEGLGSWQAKLQQSPLFPIYALSDPIFNKYAPRFVLLQRVMDNAEMVIKQVFNHKVSAWQLLCLMGMMDALYEDCTPQVRSVIQDAYGYGINHYLIIGGHLELCKSSLVQSPYDKNFVVLAACCGHRHILEFLQQHKFPLIEKNADLGALHYAVMNGKIDTALWLIKECNLNPNQGESILVLAAEHGHWDLFKKLVEYVAIPDKHSTEFARMLYAAAEYGQKDWLCKQMDVCKEIQPKTFVYNGGGFFTAAISGGQFEMTEYVIEQQWGMIDQRFERNQSVLHVAACRGQIDLIFNLLKKYPQHLSLTDTDEEGNTVAHGLASHGDWWKYRRLLGIPKALTRNNQGVTEAHMAAKCGKINFLMRLIQHYGVEGINTKDANNRTLMHYAFASLNFSLINWLVEELKLSIHDLDNNGENIVFMAAKECINNPSLWTQLVYNVIMRDEALMFQKNNAGVCVFDYIFDAGCENLLIEQGFDMEEQYVLDYLDSKSSTVILGAGWN